MKWIDFLNKSEHLDIIDQNVINLYAKADRGFYNQISYWTRQGKLVKISKNRYVVSQRIRKRNISNVALASRINPQSYVSCETVLALEFVIPDIWHDKIIKSVSTTKTKTFVSAIGTFYFQHVKPSMFCGYYVDYDEFNKPFFRASTTKALLDYLYLETKLSDISTDYLENNLRLQNIKKINLRELRSFKRKISKKIDLWIATILKYYKEQEIYE